MSSWNIKQDQVFATPEEIISALLANRDIVLSDTFFSPPPPREWDDSMHGISMAQIYQFRDFLSQQQGPVLVYGDYDADGVLASAIMASVLEHLGHEVIVYIPDRKLDGYGMSEASLTRILQTQKFSMVVTVDQGIKAHQAVQFLRDSNIKVIITDHHIADSSLPQADLIIHSTLVCGSGVAYFLTRHLATRELNDINLQLAAIGTVTDVMSLRDINRHLVWHGLLYLTKTSHPGLLALFESAQIHLSSIESYHLGYQIGPRLNAEGRIGDPMVAYKLLRSNTRNQAMDLAAALNQTNRSRQELTEQMLAKALKQVDPHQKIIITTSNEYDEGIIGLIAGKLTQTLHRPAIAISHDDTIAKGSARSIKSINIVQILDQASHLLSSYGGHAQAGGFNLPFSKLSQFTDLINEISLSIDDNLLQKNIDVECLLQFNSLNQNLVESLNKFAPFGHGNHRPVFASKNILIKKVFPLGKDNRHLKLILDDSLSTIECLAWGIGDKVEEFHPGKYIDIAYNVKSSIWRDQLQINLELVDYHPC